MRADLTRVRSVRAIDGKPSRLPRVSTPAAGLTAAGWTVYSEPGPLLRALIWPARRLVAAGHRRRLSLVPAVVRRRG